MCVCVCVHKKFLKLCIKQIIIKLMINKFETLDQIFVQAWLILCQPSHICPVTY